MLIEECDLLFTDHHFSCMWVYEIYVLSMRMARVWTYPLTLKILKISFLDSFVQNIYFGFGTGNHCLRCSFILSLLEIIILLFVD